MLNFILLKEQNVSTGGRYKRHFNFESAPLMKHFCRCIFKNVNNIVELCTSQDTSYCYLAITLSTIFFAAPQFDSVAPSQLTTKKFQTLSRMKDRGKKRHVVQVMQLGSQIYSKVHL